jgi:excisionase family DNA binding protein
MSSSKPATRAVQTLEGTLLRALNSSTSRGAKVSKKILEGSLSRRAASTKGALPSDRIGRAAVIEDSPAAHKTGTAEKMATQARNFREQLTKLGLVTVETVRFRPRGLTDRRLIVEYAPDPEDSRAVWMRVRPATESPLPRIANEMLTTQQAADRLKVSRPYVAQLVDSGRFEGIERTRSGHRRIPASEVERVHEEMRSTRRAALDDMAKETRDLRLRELDAAKAKSTRRWIAKTK